MLALVIAVLLTPVVAAAGGQKRHRWDNNPSDGYTVPIQVVFQFPAATANQPTAPWGYAAPFQAVYQFPAVFANQPGADVPFLSSDPTSGLLGGRSYLYHP
jgi:hypothetical protein